VNITIIMGSDDSNPPLGMTDTEKIEYETCVKMAIHYETLRMGLLTFFAVFNGALFGFLGWIYSSNNRFDNGYVVVAIGLFAFAICMVILNGEIREMCYWTNHISRAREIEENVNERNKNDKKKNMDNFTGGLRELVYANKWKKYGVPDDYIKKGYCKPKRYEVIWYHPIIVIFGGSRRITMPLFYLAVAIGWLLFVAYGVALVLELI
jgi:hypothetical protein